MDNPRVVEGNPHFPITLPTMLTFRVTAGGCTNLAARVSIQANDTSIPQDNDFDDTAVALSWPAGNAEAKTVTVRVNPDVAGERDEDIALHVCHATALVQPHGGLGTIINDDGGPHRSDQGDSGFVCK